MFLTLSNRVSLTLFLCFLNPRIPLSPPPSTFATTTTSQNIIVHTQAHTRSLSYLDKCDICVTSLVFTFIFELCRYMLINFCLRWVLRWQSKSVCVSMLLFYFPSSQFYFHSSASIFPLSLSLSLSPCALRCVSLSLRLHTGFCGSLLFHHNIIDLMHIMNRFRSFIYTIWLPVYSVLFVLLHVCRFYLFGLDGLLQVWVCSSKE